MSLMSPGAAHSVRWCGVSWRSARSFDPKRRSDEKNEEYEEVNLWNSLTSMHKIQTVWDSVPNDRQGTIERNVSSMKFKPRLKAKCWDFQIFLQVEGNGQTSLKDAETSKLSEGSPDLCVCDARGPGADCWKISVSWKGLRTYKPSCLFMIQLQHFKCNTNI